MNYSFLQTRFIKFRSNTKLIRIISAFAILLSFCTIILISFFHSGFRFEGINQNDLENVLRTLVGLSAGFSLAVSGAGMQAVTRNQLAGPTTLGFLPAATLGILIYYLIGYDSISLMIFMAFLFALIILGINFLATKFTKNDYKSHKVILMGIILGALVSSISIVITQLVPKLNQTIIPWIGQIGLDYNWEKASYALPIILIGTLIIILFSNKLNIVENDPYLAKSLGINIDLIYWITGLASLLITVSSVILIGSLAMIGIVIPHLIRMMFKTRDYKIITPMAGLFCSTVIIFALLINSRWNIGITFFTSILSAPIFIYLVLRKKGGD
ncbi:MAG: iron ABC transporter permease [Mycoplasmoidaceae bacterium]